MSVCVNSANGWLERLTPQLDDEVMGMNFKPILQDQSGMRDLPTVDDRVWGWFKASPYVSLEALTVGLKSTGADVEVTPWIRAENNHVDAEMKFKITGRAGEVLKLSEGKPFPVTIEKTEGSSDWEHPQRRGGAEAVLCDYGSIYEDDGVIYFRQSSYTRADPVTVGVDGEIMPYRIDSMHKVYTASYNRTPWEELWRLAYP